MIASQVYQTHLPWWGYIITILIGTVFILPVGMACTGPSCACSVHG